MTEEELYRRAVELRKQTNELVDDVMNMQPTIELCLFVGKLGAVLDVLIAMEEAGVPTHDPGEEPHPL